MHEQAQEADASAERQAAAEVELNDLELEQVVGGLTRPWLTLATFPDLVAVERAMVAVPPLLA